MLKRFSLIKCRKQSGSYLELGLGLGSFVLVLLQFDIG